LVLDAFSEVDVRATQFAVAAHEIGAEDGDLPTPFNGVAHVLGGLGESFAVPLEVAAVVSEAGVKIEPRLDILTSVVAKAAHEDVALLDVDIFGGEMEGHDV